MRLIDLFELTFMGSACTKDCSGHKAGFNWSTKRGGKLANSWSPSFNKGSALAIKRPTNRIQRKINQVLKSAKKRKK